MGKLHVKSLIVVLILLFGNNSLLFGADYVDAPVYQFGSHQRVGHSTLLRSPTGLSFHVATSGPADGSELDGHLLSIWLLVFNRGEYCTTEGGRDGLPHCGLDDLVSVLSGGPNTAQIDIVYATGKIVGSGGNTQFAGFVKEGDIKQTTFSLGLVDSSQAEIHVLVRSHGPFASGVGQYSGDLSESVGSFIDGCQGITGSTDLGTIPLAEGQCNDIFYSVHVAE